MEEKNEKLEGGDVKIKLRVPEKLENFWYYYKWHTIIGVIVVFALIVLTLQTCSRTEIDSYVMYAGPHAISRTSHNGDISEYEIALTGLKRISSDYNEDGKHSINFLDLFVVNSEEADKILEDNPGMEINAALVNEDVNTLSQRILYGEYYLCFLSERLFNEYEKKYEGVLFTDLAPYVPENAEYEFATEHGIYLRSLPFYSLPEICDLPEDTVVCLRRLSEVSNLFGKEENEEFFRRGEDMLKKLLSYGSTAK